MTSDSAAPDPRIGGADGDAATIRENPQVREVYFGTGKTFAEKSA